MRRLLLAAASLAATTTVMAAIPSEVAIDSGTVFGTTGASPEIRVFKGIRFAAPPVGANRLATAGRRQRDERSCYRTGCGDAGFFRFGIPTTPEGRC